MDLNEFKELEETIKGDNFAVEYKNINWVMFGLSIFGNIASIFLAYFLLSKILSSAIVDNPILVTISSVILLAGLELLKRDIFKKLSAKAISDGFKNKALVPLAIMAVIVVSFSFYATITGAKEFSSKTEEIEKVAQVDTKKYTDSLTSVYNVKIQEKEAELKSFKEKVDAKDQEQTSLESVQPLTPAQRSRVRDLKAEKEILRQDIALNDSSIANLKRELQTSVKQYQDEVASKTNKEKDKNKSNTLMFIGISSIIEILILAGIYFNRYYKIRSYNEFKTKLDKDPNFKRFVLYNSMLDVVYTPDTKINDKFPNTKMVVELMKLNGTILLPKDVLDCIKVFSSLGIIRTSGSAKYFGKNKESAREILKSHFNIK